MEETNPAAGGAATAARSPDDDSLTTVDGAVRQMEKSLLVNARPTGTDGTPPRPDPAVDPDFGEVVPLGKDTSGAQEEDAADIAEFSPDGERNDGAYEV